MDTLSSAKIAENLRLALAEDDRTQGWLSRKLGVHPTWLARRLSEDTPFKVDDVGRICDVMPISLERILGLERVSGSASDIEPVQPDAAPAGSLLLLSQ